MSTNLPEEWHADETRKRRLPFVGPFSWYFAGLWAVLVILFFCAVYLTSLLGWGGVGTWPIIAILAGEHRLRERGAGGLGLGHQGAAGGAGPGSRRRRRSPAPSGRLLDYSQGIGRPVRGFARASSL